MKKIPIINGPAVHSSISLTSGENAIHRRKAMNQMLQIGPNKGKKSGNGIRLISAAKQKYGKKSPYAATVKSARASGDQARVQRLKSMARDHARSLLRGDRNT